MSALRAAGLRLPAVSHISRSVPTSTCCCLHLRFLQTVPGTLKLLQVMIGSLCETLLVCYGMGQHLVLGNSLITLLTTTSSCLWVTTLLLVCYVCSSKSYTLIRSSLLKLVSVQELVVSVVATLSLLSASVFMCLRVELLLYPLYALSPIGFTTYPVLVAAYMLGFVLTILYALDTYHSYRYINGYH